MMSASRSVSVPLQSAPIQVAACFLRLANRVEEGWGGCREATLEKGGVGNEKLKEKKDFSCCWKDAMPLAL